MINSISRVYHISAQNAHKKPAPEIALESEFLTKGAVGLRCLHYINPDSLSRSQSTFTTATALAARREWYKRLPFSTP